MPSIDLTKPIYVTDDGGEFAGYILRSPFITADFTPQGELCGRATVNISRITNEPPKPKQTLRERVEELVADEGKCIENCGSCSLGKVDVRSGCNHMAASLKKLLDETEG